MGAVKKKKVQKSIGGRKRCARKEDGDADGEM